MMGYLDIAPEIAEALRAGRPVVALESTIIAHGMPFPQNLQTARQVEQEIRDAGALPATIAILDGRLKVGLTAGEIERAAQERAEARWLELAQREEELAANRK